MSSPRLRPAFRAGFELVLHLGDVVDAVDVDAAVDHNGAVAGGGVRGLGSTEAALILDHVLAGSLRELLVHARDDVPRLLLRRQGEPAGVEGFPGGGTDP